jgi:hypothetical protein
MTAASREPVTEGQLRDRTDEARRTLRAAPNGAEAVQLAVAYRQALQTCPPGWPYYRVSDHVLAVRDTLRRGGGTALVAAFHRYVILLLVPVSRRKLQECPHLAPVREFFEHAVTQIVSDLTAIPDADLDFHSDPFLKDLSVVALRLWPLGVVGVEPRLRMPQRWIIQGGPRTFLAGVGVLARLRRAFPLYEIHVYNRQLSEFTEPGWEASYRRIARIMQAEPDVRGLYGGAWFFDPAVKKVSPRLAYLTRLPMEHGAVFARIPNTRDTCSDALQKSPTRRELYGAGKYQPRQYVMIWPRRELLRWAGTPLKAGG